MSSYPIDFSDPLKPGFSIPAGGFNGPGGSAANTSLRLYGRGALEWGEAVNEDLVRLTENFASATPPKNPITGQLWHEVSLYCKDITVSNPQQGWYRYDIASSTWTLLNTSGTVASVPTLGQTYYYDSVAGKLYGYYSMVKPEAQVFVPRSFTQSSGAPTIAPPQALRVWDGYANGGVGTWVSPTTINATSGIAPTNPQVGSLWYDLSVGKLKLWSGVEWQEILGPSTGSLALTARGNIDMTSTYNVVNLPLPQNSGDAASKAYVDSQLSGGLSGYVSLAGSNMVGPGNINSPGSLTFAGTGTFGNVTTAGVATVGRVTSTSTAASTFAGPVNVTGNVSVTGGQVKGISAGTVGTDAVNLTQMNASITTAVQNLGGISSNTVPVIFSSGTYKVGDLCITGGKIYMAIGSGTGGAPGGNWKQIWPSTYS